MKNTAHIAIALILMMTVAGNAQQIVWHHFPNGVMNSPTATMQASVGGISMVKASSHAGFLWATAKPVFTTFGDKTKQPLRPTYTWSDAYNAYLYEVQVATSVDFSSGVQTPVFLSAIQNNAVLSVVQSSDLTAGNRYYWRVRGYHTGGISEWSDVSDFDVSSATLGVPPQLSPANGAYVQTPSQTFSWGTVSTATGYEYQIATDAGFSQIIATNVGSSTASLSISSVTLSNVCSTYYWRVRAVRGTEQSGWSSVWTLIYAPQPAQVSLNSPADNTTFNPASGRRPTFTWNPAVNAQSYVITLTKNGVDSTITVPATTTTFSIGNDLDLGVTYTWKVTAKGCNGGQDALASVPRTFIIQSGAPQPCLITVTLQAPAKGATVSSPVTLNWTPSGSGAVGYDVEVSEDPTFTTNVSSSQVTSTIDTRTVADGKTYYWRVRARCATNNGAYSDTSSFRTASVAPCLTINDYNFDSLLITNSRSRVVRLVNTLSTVARLDSFSVPADYEIVFPKNGIDLPKILRPNDTIEITIRVRPTSLGLIQGVVQAHLRLQPANTPCIATGNVRVVSVAISKAASNIIFERIDGIGEVNPGDFATLRLRLDNTQGSISPTSMDSMSIVFQYDRRAFQIDENTFQIQSLAGVTPFKGQTTPILIDTAKNWQDPYVTYRIGLQKPQMNNDREIMRFMMQAKIATTDTTRIRLADFRWYKAGTLEPVQSESIREEELLLVAKVCREGRTPNFVLDPTGKKTVALMAIFPNPAQNELTCDIHAEQSTMVRAVLHDLYGREVSELYSGIVQQGISSITYPISNIPTGVYSLTLHFLNGVVGEQVYIVR
ncbi:MAG: hypothetical protein JNL32_14445 [Candidatus Kapabacteria bacterium]|nr:hypothetical protein [Candidatus Kapabacteria bacterium]